jgi:hypothetical protein
LAIAWIRFHWDLNSSGVTLFVIQPSACFATRRRPLSTAGDGALAPSFQVRPVGLLAIQIGSGFWTGRGWIVTPSNS